MTKMPKEECEDLMNALLPVVKKLLSEHVEFFPVGGTMQTDGSIAFVSTYDGDEHPPSQKVIDSLMEVFRAGAKQKKYKATALIYDIRTIPPEATEKTDAPIELWIRSKPDASSKYGGCSPAGWYAKAISWASRWTW